jgi:hypothetical protein
LPAQDGRAFNGNAVSSNDPMLRRTLLAFASLLILVPLGCAGADRLWAVQALPDGIGAYWVSYADNRTYGFGPGGNETGFNVVLLTKAGAARVAEGGASWLDAQPGGRVGGEWFETPVPGDEVWQGREGSALGRFPTPTIDAILWRYGFGPDLPPDQKAAVDAALNAPGSFYSFGHGGTVVIIVPATARAYVVYAG